MSTLSSALLYSQARRNWPQVDQLVFLLILVAVIGLLSVFSCVTVRGDLAMTGISALSAVAHWRLALPQLFTRSQLHALFHSHILTRYQVIVIYSSRIAGRGEREERHASQAQCITDGRRRCCTVQYCR
jgi:hypothetical protein